MAATSMNSRSALVLLLAVLLCEFYGAHAVEVNAPRIAAPSSNGGARPEQRSLKPASHGPPYWHMEEQVRKELNTIRAQAGLHPLQRWSVLCRGSRQWSRYLAANHQFYHATLGDPVYAENIAMGYTSADDVTEGWQNSEGHRRNRMNPSYTHYGIGIWADSDGTLLFTERFGYDR